MILVNTVMLVTANVEVMIGLVGLLRMARESAPYTRDCMTTRGARLDAVIDTPMAASRREAVNFFTFS